MMTLRIERRLTAAVAVVLPLGAVGATAAASAANLVETVEQRGRFGTLVRAIEAAGVTDTLASEGPFTLFAPTDEAFAALPEGILDDLLAGDPARLEALLGHHVIAGRAYPSNRLPLTLEPLAGGPILVDFEPGALTLRNVVEEEPGDGGRGAVPETEDLSRRQARVVIGDIEADNGVVHAIDAVLVPSDLVPAEAAVAEAPPTPPAAAGPTEQRSAEEVAQQQPVERPESGPQAGDAGGAAVQRRAEPEEPEVTVTTPTGEPEVTVERAEPEVILVQPEADLGEPGERTAAEPMVGVEPAEPEAAAAEPTIAPEPAEEPQAVPERPELATAEPAEEAPPQAEEPAEPAEEPRIARTDPEPEEEPEADARPTPAAELVSFEELMGRPVRSSQGDDLGDVSDIIFSKSTGEIELLVVDVGGFLGLWEKPVAVPWREVRVDGADATLIADLTREDLEAASAFDYEALDTATYRAYAEQRTPAGG